MRERDQERKERKLKQTHAKEPLAKQSEVPLCFLAADADVQSICWFSISWRPLNHPQFRNSLSLQCVLSRKTAVKKIKEKMKSFSFFSCLVPFIGLVPPIGPLPFTLCHLKVDALDHDHTVAYQEHN